MITAEELQNTLESWAQKASKNDQTAPTSPHVVREGFKKNSRKENTFIQKQTPAYSFARHDGNFKQDWILWSDETKKKSFLTANTQDGFDAHRNKKVSHVYNEIYCCIFNVVGLFFCQRYWISCWHHGIKDSIKYQQIKM